MALRVSIDNDSVSYLNAFTSINLCDVFPYKAFSCESYSSEVVVLQLATSFVCLFIL